MTTDAMTLPKPSRLNHKVLSTPLLGFASPRAKNDQQYFLCIDQCLYCSFLGGLIIYGINRQV